MPTPKTLQPTKHRIRRLTAAAYETPWAITRQKLDTIVDLLDRRADSHLPLDEIESRLAGLRRSVILEKDDEKPYRLIDGVAVISLYGVLAPRMNMMVDFSGGTSTQEFADAVVQAQNDEDVRAIVLDVDSPGGNVLGVAEAAEIVRIASERKPVVTVATGEMCSAAYFIGSAARKVVASPSSRVGSLGVYMIHTDRSARDTVEGVKRTVIHAGARKTIGNPDETLTQTARDTLRSEVQDYYAQFIESVARYRGKTVDEVEADFGQGDVMIAGRALAAGLIDRIGTLSEIVDELGASQGMTSPGPVALIETTPFVSTTRETSMDPKIIERLRALKLIDPTDDKKTAEAVLRAWFAARGQTVPDEPEAVLTALADKPQDLRQPPSDPSSASAATSQGPGPGSASIADPNPSDKVAQERDRILSLQSQGELLGVGADEIRAAVETGTSLADFLRKVTKDQAAAKSPVKKIEAGESSQEKFADAAADALAMRTGIRIEKPAAGAQELQYARLIDIAAEALRVKCGRRPIGSPDDIARAALGDPEPLSMFGADVPYSTPGDFPNILSVLANKTLDAAPQYVGTSFQNWAARKPSVPDFKPATLVKVGEFSEFPYHPDGADFEQSKPTEDWSWIAVDSYGDEFALTPKMMVDDNLGAFTEALTDKQAAHDHTLNRLCVNILTGNPTLPDGGALFNATAQTTAGGHANYVASSSGAAPSTTTLSAARLALRKMLGTSLKRKLNYTVFGLLVPEDLETVTQQLLSATLQIYPTVEGAAVANVTDGPQLFRGQVTWWVDPMLGDSSTTAWYAFANPAIARAIVYCYQQGFEGMVTRNYYNPKNNCRIWQFEGRFAAGVNNYRGVYMNYGA